MVELLIQMLSSPYYEQLRTKEQLGYIVFARDRSDHNIVSVSLILQSSEKSPMYMLERSDSFLQVFYEYLKQVPESEVDQNIASLTEVIMEKEKKLNDQALKYYAEIKRKQYKFDRKEAKAKFLQTVKKQHLVAFFEKYILLDSPDCRRLLVQVFSKKQLPEMQEKSSRKQSVFVKDIVKTKQVLPFYASFVQE